MPFDKNVQDAHISQRLTRMHHSLMRIVSVMNRPQVDERMVREAGITLDRALFPVLVGIERLGPIGVVELADHLGRDYTTVSRQIAKLEHLGLISRQAGMDDRRVREAIVTSQGKAMTDAVDIARQRLGSGIFADWQEQDVEDFVRFLQRFAEDVELAVTNNATPPELPT